MAAVLQVRSLRIPVYPISSLLQANDVSTPKNMRSLLYQLANRLISSSPSPSFNQADRFHLHLSILRELGLYDEASKLLDSDIGKYICSTSLVCNEIRRDICRDRGLLQEEGKRAEELIVEHKFVALISTSDAFSDLQKVIGTGSSSLPFLTRRSPLLRMRRVKVRSSPNVQGCRNCSRTSQPKMVKRTDQVLLLS